MANSGLLSQGSAPRLLQEGINAIATLYYKQFPTERSKIFTIYESNKDYELDVLMTGTGYAKLKGEGEALLNYQAEKQDFTALYKNSVYAIGTIITMEAMMNNLWQNLIETSARLLTRSLKQTDEQLAANVINNGYDSSYPTADGEPLFSTSHLLGGGGTYSNMFAVPTDLSQTAVEDALIAIDDFRDGSGLFANVSGVSLHVGIDLRFESDRILASKFEPGSDLNAVNPVAQIFPQGYNVHHYFTDPTTWFIKTDVENGFKCFERMPYTFQNDNDLGTGNYRVKGMFYNSYGVTDVRCAYGSGQ